MPEEIVFEGRGVYVVGIEDYEEMVGQIADLTARLAEAEKRIAAFESALDSWMVINWAGVYDSEKGVRETVSLCLEKALDVERDTLRAEVARHRKQLNRKLRNERQ